MRRQCELLGVNRSSLYYEPVEPDSEELSLMRRLDELHLKHPFFGSRMMGIDLLPLLLGGGGTTVSGQPRELSAQEKEMGDMRAYFYSVKDEIHALFDAMI